MKNSFRLFTVMGIPIEIHFSWFIIFGLIVFTLARGYFPMLAPGIDPLIYWIMALIAAVLLFSCLLLHELSHSIVAKANRLPIAGITLFVFGGVAHMEKEPNSPAVEFKMAAAGPLMSLFLAMFFLLLTFLGVSFKINRLFIIICNYLYILNLALAAFNLIPGFPLDGGRLFRAILWHFLKDIKKATRIASVFGKAFAFILMGTGLFWFLTGYFIGGAWFMFIGFFLYEAAETSYRQLLMKKIFSKVRVKDIMSRDVISIPSRENIENIVNNYIFKYRHSAFPVIEDDILLGIITFHDIKEVPKEEWGKKTAKDIVIPVTKNLTISPDAYMSTALTQIASNGIGRVLAIKDQKITGILSHKDIVRLFEIKNSLEG